MKTTYRRFVSAMGALALALVVVPGALAQCGLATKPIKPMSWHPLYRDAHPTIVPAGLNDGDEREASIVGMWHVVFTAQTSNGQGIPDTVVDNALVVWHADNTEIMNSVRPPQDGDFCLGVWQQTEKSKYYLNHFAWFGNMFPNDSSTGIGAPVGPTHITETVTLSPDGNHFSGAFTLDAYDATGTTIFQSFTGFITGTRITTRTTTGDLL